MGARVRRLSFLAALLTSLPGAMLPLLVPTEAHAQSALTEPLVELVPPGEVVADGVSSVTLYVVALEASGAPIADLAPKGTASGGKIGTFEVVSPGVYKVAWTPPKVDAGKSFDISLKGKTADKKPLDRRWSLATVPSLAQQVKGSASPAQIVLGQDGTAALNITLSGGPTQPLAGVQLDVRVSSGKVENITHLGGGQFTALYTPPNPKGTPPQLALFTLADKRDPTHTYGAFVVPLMGKGTFTVPGLPNSRVMVKVGEREFPPTQADASGAARVDLVVPPGIYQASVLSILGEQRVEKPMNLDVPPTPRVLLFPMPAAVPADASVGIPVRVFVATPAGAPDAAAQVSFTATAGSVSAARHEGNGIYVATYTPPAASTGASVTVQANVADARGTQTNAVSFNTVPTRAGSVALSAEPAALGPDATSLKVLAKVKGADNQGQPRRTLVFAADGATLSGAVKDLGSGDYQAQFTTTGTGPVNIVGTVTAAASANPLRTVLAFPSRDRLPNDGLSSSAITVITLDEFGYPVANVPLRIAVAKGEGSVPATATTNESGIAQIYYTAGRKAGLVNLLIGAGDHTGSVSLLQAPADVAPALSVPKSGSDALAKQANGWKNIVSTLHIPRSAAAAVVTTASPWAAGGASTAAVAKIAIKSTPATVAPGETVEIELTAMDAQGAGVDGRTFEFLTSAGTISAVQPLGGGRYRATLSVPAGTSAEVKLSAATSDGQVSSFVKIPVSAPAGSVWGAGATATTTPTEPAAPSWGGGSTTTTPATLAPTTTPETAASAMSAAASTTAATTKVKKTPANDDRPWLRLQAGYAGGFYSYQQTPAETGSPMYKSSIAFGALSDQEGSTSAPTVGLDVHGRAWLPGMRWLGLDAGVRASYYSVEIPAASATIPDWVTAFHATALPRYRWDSGGSQLAIAGRVGLSASDFMVYQQPPGTQTLNYGPLFVPSLDLGGEFDMELGKKAFANIGGTVGLANASTPYSFSGDLSFGYAFAEHIYARAGGSYTSRSTEVWLSPTDEKLDKREAGEIADRAAVFSVAVGYQL